MQFIVLFSSDNSNRTAVGAEIAKTVERSMSYAAETNAGVLAPVFIEKNGSVPDTEKEKKDAGN